MADDEIDYDLGLANASAMVLATPAALPVVRPDEGAWQDVLGMLGRALPLRRACALAGLDYRAVQAWLRTDGAARQRADEATASASARLLGVVWNEAIEEGSWKAALSLLRHVDPAFQPPRKKAKQTGPAQLQITAQTAQVISGASLEDLKRSLGRV